MPRSMHLRPRPSVTDDAHLSTGWDIVDDQTGLTFIYWYPNKATAERVMLKLEGSCNEPEIACNFRKRSTICSYKRPEEISA